MKFKLIVSYFLIFIFSIQSAAASFDVHNGKLTSQTIDITTHYIDEHGSLLACNHISTHTVSMDQDNIDNLASDQSGDYHHGCSGHLMFISFKSFTYLNISFFPSHTHFTQHFDFYSVIPSPSYKPPIS